MLFTVIAVIEHVPMEVGRLMALPPACRGQAFERAGFYVFEGAIGHPELAELQVCAQGSVALSFQKVRCRISS